MNTDDGHIPSTGMADGFPWLGHESMKVVDGNHTWKKVWIIMRNGQQVLTLPDWDVEGDEVLPFWLIKDMEGWR